MQMMNVVLQYDMERWEAHYCGRKSIIKEVSVCAQVRGNEVGQKVMLGEELPFYMITFFKNQNHCIASTVTVSLNNMNIYL